MKKKKFVWAIFDYREGNRNQLLGVLSELKLPYKIIEVNYNIFSIMPNFLIQLFNGSIHIKECMKKIICNPYPDLIISCGRRTAPLSLKIYKRLKIKPILIHLMVPRYTFLKKYFNIIFTPQHDETKDNVNIFKTLGSPNNIKIKINEQISQNKSKIFTITLLLGGDHARYKLSERKIKFLLRSIEDTIEFDFSLLITTSRRTNKGVIEYLNHKAKSEFSFIKEIYHPTKKSKNLLNKFLQICDEIVVTGDSMSMISEACSIKKPVRIFYNSDFCSSKHILFCKKMIDEKYAFPLNTVGERVEKVKILNTSKIISDRIKLLILNNE